MSRHGKNTWKDGKWLRPCSRCKLELPLKKFGHRNDGSEYLRSWCKRCDSESHPYIPHFTTSKKRSNTRKYRRKLDGWAPGEHEKAEAALAAGIDKCSCCSSIDARSKHGWIADHNHATGTFRAYVCHPCNVIIGYAERYGLCRDSADIDLYLVKYNV